MVDSLETCFENVNIFKVNGHHLYKGDNFTNIMLMAQRHVLLIFKP